MSIQKTAIIGTGALGLLYGTHILDHKTPESVTYVMDSARYEKNKNKIFYKNGKPYHLSISVSQTAVPADLVIVAVKYNGLESALDTMKNCVGEHTIIISVMNGITSEDILARRFGKKHLIYTVAQGMDAMKFNDELTFTKMGELRIGAEDIHQRKNLETVSSYFDEIQMPYTVDENIIHRMWGKFMLNVGVNQSCMVYETNYGGCLKPGEPNRTMIAAMREVIALANAEGVKLGEKDLNEYMTIIKTLSPDSMPSMRQDGVAGRYSEVEMFAGTVITLAQKHEILVPANQFLYDRVKEMESKYTHDS